MGPSEGMMPKPMRQMQPIAPKTFENGKQHEHEQDVHLGSVQHEGVQLESYAQVSDLGARKGSQLKKRTPLLLCHDAVLGLSIKPSKRSIPSLLLQLWLAFLNDWVTGANARTSWRAWQMHELEILSALCEAQ
jgi:hypothetical protein